MTDLSSPEIQAVFKKLQRTTIITNVIMCVVTVAAAGVAIWASTLGPRDSTDWAEILFFVLIGLIFVYFCFVIVWEVRLRIKCKRYLCSFIAEGYATEPSLTAAGDAAYELMLVGDKLTVMRTACQNSAANGADGKYIQFDLSCVKTFTGVCANLARYARDYLTAYYTVRGGADEVKITDNIHGNAKIRTVVKGGTVCKQLFPNAFVKWGLIT